MKKLLFLAMVTGLTTFSAAAQVFNTASTLKKGTFSAGIEPGVYLNGATDFNLFLHGGAGLTNNLDFGLKLGVLGRDVYFGGDVEFALASFFSFSAGAHNYGDFGLDFTGLFTFPIGNSVDLFTGLDSDIVFSEPDTRFPLWIPLGIEVPLRSSMLFVFESEISVNDPGRHFLGGGLNFIF